MFSTCQQFVSSRTKLMLFFFSVKNSDVEKKRENDCLLCIYVYHLFVLFIIYFVFNNIFTSVIVLYYLLVLKAIQIEMNFLNDKGNSNHNIAVSTDGLRTVMKTPSVGEKEKLTAFYVYLFIICLFCLLFCHRSKLFISIKINTNWLCIVFNLL